jgi:hypothetical protein
VDEATFATSTDGTVVIDVERAQRLVELRNLDLAAHPHELQCRATILSSAPVTVEVECVGRAEAVLLPVAGPLGRMDLRGRATASALVR